MFKRKQRPERPVADQAASVPTEDKVFTNTDGSISMSRPLKPDKQDDFGGTRLNAPPASLATAPQPPD